MLISIIIATYNAEKTLKRCLDSIISQKDDSCEIIIIDGNSTDNTIEIVNEYKADIDYFVSEEDNGIYDAWNKGICKSKGDWLLFIGADDVLLEGAINSYLNFVKTHQASDYDFISSRIESVTEDGKFLQHTGRKWDYSRCRINMDVTHVASLTSRYYLKRVGLFNINYKICGDYELLMRGGKIIRSAFNNFVVARMPIGGASFSVRGLLEQRRIKREFGEVSIVLSNLILLFQLFLFYTYKIRHYTFKKW